METKGRVAQVKRYWLAPTETAIDRLVRSVSRHPCEVFACTARGDVAYAYPVHTPPRRLLRQLVYRWSRGRKMPAVLRDWFTLEFVCRDVRLVHAHFATDALFFAPVAKAADVPFLISCHGHDVYRFPNRLCGFGRVLLRRLFSEATLVTAVSDHMRAQIVRLGCPHEKVRTVRVGVNLSDYSFTPRTLGTEKLRLACIASFRPKKGLKYLLEAMRKLIKVRPGVELLIVGDGPLRYELERTISRFGLWGAVTLTGNLPSDQVAQVLADSHLYVQPSITAADGDCEGIPAAMMEAMASGLPVVATHHAGIPELVEDGKMGILVPERDPDALANGLLRMCEQSHLWPEMGLAARDKIRQDHDIVRQVEKVEGLYDKLLAEHDTAVVVPIGQLVSEPASRRAA